jgi:hypothetical protein
MQGSSRISKINLQMIKLFKDRYNNRKGIRVRVSGDPRLYLKSISHLELIQKTTEHQGDTDDNHIGQSTFLYQHLQHLAHAN